MVFASLAAVLSLVSVEIATSVSQANPNEVCLAYNSDPTGSYNHNWTPPPPHWTLPGMGPSCSFSNNCDGLKGAECEKYCEDIYNSMVRGCRALVAGPIDKFFCYQRAAEAYGQCLRNC